MEVIIMLAVGYLIVNLMKYLNEPNINAGKDFDQNVYKDMSESETEFYEKLWNRKIHNGKSKK